MELPGEREPQVEGIASAQALRQGWSLPLRQQQWGQCREWRVKEWREGDVVGYKGRSYEEGLSRAGSDLCYSSFPLAENGVKGRKGNSMMASEETTAIVQVGHEGGWTEVVAVERHRGARFWIC